VATEASVTLPLTEEPTGPAIRLVAVGGSAENVLVDMRATNPIDGLYPVRLLEDSEYVYEILRPGEPDSIRLEPHELFFPDPDNAAHGRLRTGSYVGVLPIEVTTNGARHRSIVEVQSRKLGYVGEYRWMLRDLADEATSLVLERFAPTRQRLSDDWTRVPRSAYERFVHLQALFADPSFEQAVLYVTNRPYVDWVERTELRMPSQPMRGGSRLGRALARPGPRVEWPGGVIRTVPAKLAVDITVPLVDNVPNRFVKHVLDHFLRLLNQVRDSLASQPESNSALRGRRETAEIEGRLEVLRSAPTFRDVGDMAILPVDNQVILKRAGYREVLGAYLRVETGTKIAWEDESLSGAQRSAATLYEYWAFLQLLRVVRSITPDLDISQLFTETKDGLTLSLKQGRERRFHGTVNCLGRDIDLDLFYNRGFGPTHKDVDGGSWSLPMRPDCSLRLQARSDGLGIAPVWLHFDAKYKLSDFGLLKDVAGVDEDLSHQPVRDDLLKMHVYLGAIRRTVGSYVLFPGVGQANDPYRAYTELLPGLGAFSLRPVAGGADTQALKAFLDNALTHVASVATQERRHRYWKHQIFPTEAPAPTLPPASREPIEGLPPADTSVLLGFVRTNEQWEWVRRNGLYNMRADPARNGSVTVHGRQASAQVLILYNSKEILGVWRLSGIVAVFSASQLLALGYPGPRGEAYVCVQMEERLWDAGESGLAYSRVRGLAEASGEPFGSPVDTSWSALTS
jgi:predicted component of viral defense system (DUF524 family)